MFLNKIKLGNIRSYVDAEINFPKGTTLLSGDVGAGKSTILLAIEFALFGLKKGAGAGILRNGANSGFVELNFDVDGANFAICRNLKRSRQGRSSESIGQDTGALNYESFSSTELRQRVLEILNYPQEFIAKEPVIYKYTVYTPQEEMKQILLGEKNIRMDTLRRVFGIDRYKRICENSAVPDAWLRERIKELKGRTFDIEDKLKELELEKKEVIRKQKELAEINPKFESASLKANEFRKKIADIEIKVKLLNELKRKLDSGKSKLSQNLKLIDYNSKKLNEIKTDVVDGSKIIVLEKEMIELRNAISTIKENARNSESIINKICRLDVCPTCEQKVSEEYRKNVASRERKTIDECNAKLCKHEKLLTDRENELKLSRKKYEEYTANLKLRNELSGKNEMLAGENELFAGEISRHEAEILGIADCEKEYDIKRKELDSAINELRKIEIAKAGAESDLRNYERNILVLEKEVMEKLNCKTEMEKWSRVQFFLKAQFILMVQEMEKKIMLKVHADFNSLFRKWLNMIVPSELIDVQLDDEFTPLIEQNGHEIDYSFLSGGEKTAIALAYRLALNQVINSLMSNIKTKDLLILDEPTDGFSEEQLDKVRDVLNELKIGQVIIVSHDAKIEGFVENVLRVEKIGHVSKVA